MSLIFEFLIELVLELFIEGSIEVGTNKKISKWVRYPLLFMVGLFYTGLILMLVFIGIKLLETVVIAGIFMIAIAGVLVLGTIIMFRKKYRQLNL